MTTQPQTSLPRIRPEQLREIGLFGGLSDETISSLVSELVLEQIEPGTLVMREGETAREMFVVLGGELEVLKRGAGGNEARVAMLGPGDWVGEMSIIDVMPRSATVRALAPSLLLKISAEDLDKLYRRDVKSYALFVLNMARELSRRLRVADGILAGVIASVWDEYLGATRRNSSPGGHSKHPG
ncbi:MAG: cyclic nucleotide-binding domain-containing protein [Polyangiales bacterium]